MRLLEHQAKALLSKFGVSVPSGEVTSSSNTALEAAEKIGFPVVLKAQIPVGGRAKAGLISKVNAPDELKKAFGDLMAKQIGGSRPSSILVEKFLPHDEEFYLSIALDRGRRSFVAIASKEGGVDVETIGEKAIAELNLEKFDAKLAGYLAQNMGLDAAVFDRFARLFQNLFTLAASSEVELAEINPLVNVRGEFIALDAKIILDDNALFRHKELVQERGYDLEEEAASKGLAFVKLDGDMAVIGNGAGLVLATLDLVVDSGGKPACFMDLGGGASSERVYSAMEIISRLPGINALFMNIFGGITRCTDVAEAVIRAYSEGLIKHPFYARISGAVEEEARKMLSTLPIKLCASAEDAAQALIRDLQK